MEPVVYTPVSATANLRRSAVIGALLGVIAIVLTSMQGHPLMGVFALVGIAVGAVNNRMLQLSVIQFAMSGLPKTKFRGGVFFRLAGVTVIAVVLALLFQPDGLGLVAGVGAFQIIMLVGAALPVFRSMRPST